MKPMKAPTLIAFGLIVLTVLLIWRPAGPTVPSASSGCNCPFCNQAPTETPQTQGKVSEALPPVGNRAAAKSSSLVDLPSQNGPLRSKPAKKPAAVGKVVATVNGEPISASELMAGLPDDAFESELDALKKSTLRRLVEEAVECQFLKDRKVTLSDEEFKKATADFETMIKTPGCPCCGGGYANLDEFMRVNGFSPQEVQRRITCDSGLKLYAARLEKEQTAPQVLAETVKKHRAEIEKNHVMAYMISFDYTRDPDHFRDEKAVQAKKEKLANDALARLKKGDSFEKVAKDLSVDGMSDPKGGGLECIRPDLLDPEVQAVLAALEPDKFSPVIKTDWGCCIVKRKKLTDEDIVSVVKDQAKTFAEDQVYRELDAWRKRAKIQYSAAYAPAPAESIPKISY